MNIETKLLNLIRAEQRKYALEALLRPQAKDAFEYGYRSGYVAGLVAAENILINLIKEEKDADK